MKKRTVKKIVIISAMLILIAGGIVSCRVAQSGYVVVRSKVIEKEWGSTIYRADLRYIGDAKQRQFHFLYHCDWLTVDVGDTMYYTGLNGHLDWEKP